MRLTTKYLQSENYFADAISEDATDEEIKKYHYSIIAKLGQLEDIEDELGIDLITLFKALEQGIYFKNEYSKEEGIVFARPTLSIHFELYVNPLCVFQLGGYGESWALTKEELEWIGHKKVLIIWNRLEQTEIDQTKKAHRSINKLC